MPTKGASATLYSSIALLIAAGLVGCGNSSGDKSASSTTITSYNGQHEEVANALVAGFEKKTGIKVRVGNGEGPELANQILAESAASPADVIFTEDSPEITLLAAKGRLAKVDRSTLAKVPAADSSPRGDWVGFAARVTALAYDPAQVPQADLPRSLLDLAKPTWKGKVGVARWRKTSSRLSRRSAQCTAMPRHGSGWLT